MGKVLEAVLHKAIPESDKLTLAKLINRFVETRPIGPELKGMLNIIREFRNIAAHAEPDEAGGILNVEPQEADFLVTTTGKLLDVIFVEPKEYAEMLESLRKKREPDTGESEESPLQG